jgi:hypothetical protein
VGHTLPAVTQLLTAIAVGLLTGGFALGGAYLGGRRDHAKWLRESRHRAYLQFMTAVDTILIEETTRRAATGLSQDGLREAILKAPGALVLAKADVTLVGPDDVAAAADNLASSVFDSLEPGALDDPATSGKIRSDREGFIAAARSVLGSA